MAKSRTPRAKRKTVLIVLFIPSPDRDSNRIDQDRWVTTSLELLGRIFGGATAFPKARGVWRDDERAGALIWDEPVIVHCYASRQDLGQKASTALGNFCRLMGRGTNQGEVGLIVENVYHAIKPE